MNNIETSENIVVVEKNAKVRKLLKKLAKENSCSFQILKDNSTDLIDEFSFVFKGKKSNIDSINSELDLAIAQYNVSLEIKNNRYQISSVIEKSHQDKEVVWEVKTGKFTKMKELIEAISDELNIPFKVSERSNGFLKGKTVEFATIGERDKTESFKKIFQNIINKSEEINNSKNKLRM